MRHRPRERRPPTLAAVGAFLLDAVSTLLRDPDASSTRGGRARVPAAVEA